MILCSKIKQELAESEEVATRTSRMTELRSELQTIMTEERQEDVSRRCRHHHHHHYLCKICAVYFFEYVGLRMILWLG